jgi:hypothetical protein
MIRCLAGSPERCEAIRPAEWPPQALLLECGVRPALRQRLAAPAPELRRLPLRSWRCVTRLSRAGHGRPARTNGSSHLGQSPGQGRREETKNQCGGDRDGSPRRRERPRFSSSGISFSPHPPRRSLSLCASVPLPQVRVTARRCLRSARSARPRPSTRPIDIVAPVCAFVPGATRMLRRTPGRLRR